MAGRNGSFKLGILLIVVIAILVIGIVLFVNSGNSDESINDVPSAPGSVASVNNAEVQILSLQEDQTGNYQEVIITVKEISNSDQVTVKFEKGIASGQQVLSIGQVIRGISIGDSNSGFTNFAIKFVRVDTVSGVKTVVLEVGANEVVQ